MRVYIWPRDTCGLFDYTARKLHTAAFQITETNTLVREGNECFLSDQCLALMTGTPLMNIKAGSEHFSVDPLGPRDSIWFPISYLSANGNKKGTFLLEGDTIKLGKARLSVKLISMGYSASPVIIDSGMPLEPNQDEDQVCRICLDNEDSAEDPLLAPCTCAGSMKYVHGECLRRWLLKKITTRHSEKRSSYFWKDMSCELCKAPLPSFVEMNGRRIELVSIKYPDKPFMLLEDFRTEGDGVHGLHILTLDNNDSLFIGRANESDLRITDISVSRKHCMITNINNSFFIEDLSSKFGTLLQAKGEINLPKDSEMVVQISRVLLKLKVKQSWKFRVCMCCLNKKVEPKSSIVTAVRKEETNQVLSVSSIPMLGYESCLHVESYK